jgi:hypothetical protein
MIAMGKLSKPVRTQNLGDTAFIVKKVKKGVDSNFLECYIIALQIKEGLT